MRQLESQQGNLWHAQCSVGILIHSLTRRGKKAGQVLLTFANKEDGALRHSNASRSSRNKALWHAPELERLDNGRVHVLQQSEMTLHNERSFRTDIGSETKL